MAYYFAINGTDYSKYVNKLKVGREHFYKSMTTAAGNTLVKYINTKRVIEVGIIPLDGESMSSLLKDVNEFQVMISYRDPLTNALVENVKCIIPNNLVEYYTIQAGNIKYKAFSLQMNEV
jgi:hypothetical protein